MPVSTDMSSNVYGIQYQNMSRDDSGRQHCSMLCDLIWHVISRSGVVISITNCYIRFTYYFTLLTREGS